jgi:O-succinylbenzoate synthase
MHFATARSSQAVLLSVKSPLFSIESKHAASTRFNADLVDCESAAFAEACESAGVRWGIVRGISDAWDESLPEQAATWIDSHGTTRVSKVLTDCLTQPSLIPRVIRLRRQSTTALRAAGEQLRAMILSELRSGIGDNQPSP